MIVIFTLKKSSEKIKQCHFRVYNPYKKLILFFSVMFVFYVLDEQMK